MSNLVPLSNDIQFENDFGQEPIALGRFVDSTAELAISYGVAGFVGFIIGGWPVLAYTAFLAANDMKWAGVKSKQATKDWKASQTAELSRLLGEEVPIATPTASPTASPRAATPTAPHQENRLIDTLIDNPYQCRAIIAGQRTGKTHGAAVATYALKQDGTKVYYINLQDHGQGNAAAFAHADKVAIGNLAALGNSRGAVDLVDDAIDIVQRFYADDDAILVIDEWMSLGAETLEVDGLDELWRQIANKATALTSNGIGSGKAIWGLAPFFKATSLRKDARTLKLFAPLVLSIAPGQSVPWQNPKNGKVTQITMNAQVIADVCTNWQNAIASPADDLSRQWKREGSDRVYWWNGVWNPVGQFPSLPTPSKHSCTVVTASKTDQAVAVADDKWDALGKDIARSAKGTTPNLTEDDDTPWEETHEGLLLARIEGFILDSVNGITWKQLLNKLGKNDRALLEADNSLIAELLFEEEDRYHSKETQNTWGKNKGTVTWKFFPNSNPEG